MSPSLSPFDPKAYYRFSNAAYPYTGISTGFKYENTPPHLGLTPYGSRSSENWQIYRQRDNSGRSVYLIRNYDYGAALQLGLTEEVRAVPRLLPRSGDLGQQWRLQVVDGKWILTNALLGNGSSLGVSGGGNSGQYTRDVPSMQPSPDGSEKWTITINVSAGEITDKEALEDLDLVQIPAPSTTSQLLDSQIPTPSITSQLLDSQIPAPSTPSQLLESQIPASSTTSQLFNSHAPTSTPLPTTYLSVSPKLETCNTMMSGFAAVFFSLFLCAAILSWRKRQTKHEYQPVQTIKEDKESDEGLPVYMEKRGLEGTVVESE